MPDPQHGHVSLAPRPAAMRMTGDRAGVVPAAACLQSARAREIGAPATPAIDAAGKWVVVIGDGGAAMDSVRAAIRQDADGITWLCSRDPADQPASSCEDALGGEGGAEPGWHTQPEAGVDVPVERIASMPAGFGHRGALRTVLFPRMERTAADDTGQERPEPGTVFHVAADLVINALCVTGKDAGRGRGEPVTGQRLPGVRAEPGPADGRVPNRTGGLPCG